MAIHGLIPSSDASRLHPPAVVSESDPGAVGAGKAWYKESTNELKVRNAADSGWGAALGAVIADASMEYAGTWNATSNTPALADGGSNPDSAIGTMYRVSTGGTIDLGSGAITFATGDYAILNSSKVWEKLDTTDLVQSVAGLTGAPTLTQLLDTLAGVANGDMLYRTGGAWARLPIGTTGQRLQVVSGAPAWEDDVFAIPVVVGDGTNVVATGLHVPIYIPIACEITAWAMGADAAGSIVIDLWVDSHANYPPDVSDTIWGTKPALAAAIKNSASGLSIAIPAGSWILPNVDSAATVKRVNLSLVARKT